jgi:6-pyruvoyltetrahydropterin/6-carboxytetrahydropterin synthase
LIALTRRYRFSAAHVLARRDWEEERNRTVYGKCANPTGHGHDYTLFVTVRGTPDPESGRLVRVADLDRIVRERVLSVLDGALLNRDVEAFEKLVPTAENIARFAFKALVDEVRPARLSRVRLVETSNNAVECGEEDV